MSKEDDRKKAFFEGYEAGKKDAEFYMLHCGDETPVSNGDKIRSMTDEELVKWIVCPHRGEIDLWTCFPGIKCEDCILDWLKQEAE